jgi:lysyl-tRNA synthetase class 2
MRCSSNCSRPESPLCGDSICPTAKLLRRRWISIRSGSSGGIGVPREIRPDALLDLALGTLIVPRWPCDTAVFLYDYPASQAALATIKTDTEPVAARFEVFVNGLELGNGFRELTDANEQRSRFEADLSARREAGIDEPPIDEAFLGALENGLPECAGVAVGIDRLLAVLTGAGSLAEVVSFPHRKSGSEPGL